MGPDRNSFPSVDREFTDGAAPLSEGRDGHGGGGRGGSGRSPRGSDRCEHQGARRHVAAAGPGGSPDPAAER